MDWTNRAASVSGANDTSQVEKAREALSLLAEMLEQCGYDMAGSVDSTQVARVLSLSHEVSGLADRLRGADL